MKIDACILTLINNGVMNKEEWGYRAMSASCELSNWGKWSCTLMALGACKIRRIVISSKLPLNLEVSTHDKVSSYDEVFKLRDRLTYRGLYKATIEISKSTLSIRPKYTQNNAKQCYHWNGVSAALLDHYYAATCWSSDFVLFHGI